MIDAITILAAAGAEESGVVERFGLNLTHISIQILSFAILAYVLYRFAFKPVLATIDERQEKIESGLKHAEEMKAKLEEAEAEKKRILQEATVEAKRIVDEARKQAESRIEKAAQEAIHQAEGIIERAERQIESDRKAMMDEVRAEIARLVVETTSKVLRKELSGDEKSRYNQAASAELAESSNN